MYFWHTLPELAFDVLLSILLLYVICRMFDRLRRRDGDSSTGADPPRRTRWRQAIAAWLMGVSILFVVAFCIFFGCGFFLGATDGMTGRNPTLSAIALLSAALLVVVLAPLIFTPCIMLCASVPWRRALVMAMVFSIAQIAANVATFAIKIGVFLACGGVVSG